MNPFIIIIDGPMGSGKSTIGNILHKQLKRTAMLSTDRIKLFVSDFTPTAKDNEMTAKVMFKMCEAYVKQGINVLLPQAFWKKEFVEPYINLAKENNLGLFMYQLEASEDVLLSRIEGREKADPKRKPASKEKIHKNLQTWSENKYDLGKVFDTTKLSAEEVAQTILKEVQNTYI